MVPKDPDDRATILARRKYFIASALAGIAVGACDPATNPKPCLNMTSQPTAPTAPTAPLGTPDAASAASAETNTPDAAPPPLPEPTTEPRVCLKMAPPKRDQ